MDLPQTSPLPERNELNASSSSLDDWRLDKETLESVTIRSVNDIRAAAAALNDAAQACGFRIAVAVDIASKEQMVDADGAILNAEVFGWVADGERWWEDSRLTLSDLSELYARYADSLGALVRRFVAGYVAAMRTHQWIPRNCSLSKREVECLRWAVIGKADNEIGTILSLSHATVRYHVQRAAEKLNAVNRSQAVFKAGQLGFLGASS